MTINVSFESIFFSSNIWDFSFPIRSYVKTMPCDGSHFRFRSTQQFVGTIQILFTCSLSSIELIVPKKIIFSANLTHGIVITWHPSSSSSIKFCILIFVSETIFECSKCSALKRIHLSELLIRNRSRWVKKGFDVIVCLAFIFQEILMTFFLVQLFLFRMATLTGSKI